MKKLTTSLLTITIMISTLAAASITKADNTKQIGGTKWKNIDIPRNPSEQRLIDEINNVPDLLPVLDQFDRQGIVKVKNIGNKISSKSYLRIDCDEQDKSKCPELDKKYKGMYMRSGEFMVEIPELNPGQTYSHRLPFWRDLSWGPGRYVISFEADFTNTNRELNESNNIGQHTLTR